jgi:thiosulfate dehydrogenase (quinone) large subunit
MPPSTAARTQCRPGRLRSRGRIAPRARDPGNTGPSTRVRTTPGAQRCDRNEFFKEADMTTGYARRSSSELVEDTGQTPRERQLAAYVFAGLRVVVGFTFLWAFLDKLFGLGYSTPSAKSWLNGGSPSKGFLSGAEGPFASFYHGIAGDTWVNWLFMIALLGLGIALMLGIGMRVAAVSGALLYLMMWAVVLPPETNPIVDDHIIGALAVIALALVHAGDTLGLGRAWKTLPIVRQNHWLI